jgi:spore coat protein U-like protein
LGDEANPGVADGSFSGTLLSGTDSLPYTIAYTNFSGAGTGKTTPKTSVLTVTIANADYVNAVPGVYTDTVTFTITY